MHQGLSLKYSQISVIVEVSSTGSSFFIYLAGNQLELFRYFREFYWFLPGL